MPFGELSRPFNTVERSRTSVKSVKAPVFHLLPAWESPREPGLISMESKLQSETKCDYFSVLARLFTDVLSFPSSAQQKTSVLIFQKKWQLICLSCMKYVSSHFH